MLVAVAAMAFVACSQEGNEVNVLSKGGKTFEFVAEFNDTRAHFEEKKDGIYPIVWDKNEEFIFAANVLDSSNAPSNVTINPSEVTFAEDTNKVYLTYTLHSWISSITPNSTIKVFNFNDMTSAYNDGAFTGTYATQTPTATSVDPNFIALVAKYQVDDNGNPELSSHFEHITAYGQITVNGIEEELKKVVLTIDDYTYNLNVEGLENKVYYFACAPDADVDNFTIRVTTVDDNVYEREYELADNKLSFTAGRINEFSVKNLVQLDKYYFAARYQSYTQRIQLGIYENASDNTLATFEVNQPSDVAILPEGTYSLANDTLFNCWHYVGWYSYDMSAATMTVEHLTEGYHIIVTYTYDGVEYTYECNGTVRAQDEYFLNPGDPMPIATPTVTVSVENDYDIVLTWDPVDGAKDYTVSWNYGESSETVTEPTFTLTGEPFTSYEFSVVANASSEEDENSHAGKASVTLGISKDENGDADFDFVYDSFESLGSNNYKFYQSSNTEHYMLLSFANDITSLEAGSYTYDLYDDIIYGADSAFNLPSYPNGSFKEHYLQDNVKVFIDVNDDKNYTVTVFCYRTIANIWENHLFKGVYNGSLSSTVEPTVLATPELAVTASGNTVNATWNDVTGAANYTVTLNGTEYNTDQTFMLFEGLEYGKEYTVTVVANPADSTANTASEAASKSVTTEADPNTGGGDEPEPEQPTGDSFTYLGRYWDVNPTAGKSDGCGVYSLKGENYDLTLYVNYNDFDYETGKIDVRDDYYYGPVWDGYTADDCIYSDGQFGLEGTYNGEELTGTRYGSSMVVTDDSVTITINDTNYTAIGTISVGQPTK